MNQLGFPILSIMLAVPFVAAPWCLFTPGEGEAKAQSARITALAATTINFVLGVVLWLNYEVGGPRWQFVEKVDLFGRFSWAMGIDGMTIAEAKEEVARRLENATLAPSNRAVGTR